MMMNARLALLLIISVVPFLGQADPPTRIGRIGYMTGSVSFQPAGVDEWVPALPNRPITTGDQIWVDEGARAEMHVGATALRLGSQTAFQFLNLDDQTAQIQLSTGSLSVHIQYLDTNQIFEVDTPNLAFSIYSLGDYRIDVQPDSQTTVVTVRSGAGDVTGGGQAFSLSQGQQASVVGDQSINYNVYDAPPPDWWDSWCLEREVREEHSPSLRYVHADMTGYVDLDDNGDWRNSPYGEVWVPRDVPGGWAPYHYGHWSWIDPWGWTWVDDAAWGFAPFHYGRWAYWNNNWAWVPGPLSATPVYAPALVAWVGGGDFGASISLGAAAVAWVPLGPREVYVPPYQVSSSYATRINVSNTVITNFNVTNIYNNVTTVNYVNARVPNAVVAVSAQAMGSAQSVHEVSRPVSAQALSSAQVMRSAQVAPQRQAVLGRPSAPASVPHPPAAVTSRPIVAKTTPPPPPVPFASRQQALQAHPGVPLNTQQVQQIRRSAPPPAHAVVIKQAPPAPQVVKPAVAPNPPRNAVQARPGQQPSQTAAPAQVNKPAPPPAYRPPAQPVQPAYHPPASPPVEPPANRPATPPERPEETKPANVPPANRPATPPERREETTPANAPPPNRPAVESTRPPVNPTPPPQASRDQKKAPPPQKDKKTDDKKTTEK
jgi:hypothetical protein